jgi:hypothetical protein
MMEAACAGWGGGGLRGGAVVDVKEGRVFDRGWWKRGREQYWGYRVSRSGYLSVGNYFSRHMSLIAIFHCLCLLEAP